MHRFKHLLQVNFIYHMKDEPHHENLQIYPHPLQSYSQVNNLFSMQIITRMHGNLIEQLTTILLLILLGKIDDDEHTQSKEHQILESWHV